MNLLNQFCENELFLNSLLNSLPNIVIVILKICLWFSHTCVLVGRFYYVK